MSLEDTISDRVERARERDLGFDVVTMDPLVVQVHSGHSDRIHTIVPDALHCSCEDDTYRGPVCYHIIGLALANDHFASAEIRRAVQDEQSRVENNIDMIEAQLEEAQRLHSVCETVLTAIDWDEEASGATGADGDETDADGVETDADGVETDADGDDIGSIVEDLT